MSNNIKSNKTPQKIAFLGRAGTYSDLACRSAYPELITLGCHSFQDVFDAVKTGKACLGVIPVDNTLAGRVADVHHLLPDGELYIIGEHFQKIEHALLGIKGSNPEMIAHVHSHIHALPQCRKLVKSNELTTQVHADTASAAKYVADNNDPAHGAISSKLAAEIYKLDVLVEDVQDANHNTTRFLIVSKTKTIPDFDKSKSYLTSFLFRVGHMSSALYKCLGGFATNGVNMAKLESYVDEYFQAAQFYCEIEGHVEADNVIAALKELSFYALDVKMLGCYEMRRDQIKH